MDTSLFSAFSSDQLTTFDSYLRHAASRPLAHQKPTLTLALVIIGEKPASEYVVLSSNSNPLVAAGDDEGFGDLLRSLDIPHIVVQQHSTHGTLRTFHCVATRSQSLPEGFDADTETAMHRAWGQHYGYPAEAIDAFVEGTCLRYYADCQDWNQLVQTATDCGLSADRLLHLSLTSFVPPATEYGIRNATRIGTRYEQQLRAIADTARLDGLTTLLDTYLNTTAELPRFSQIEP